MKFFGKPSFYTDAAPTGLESLGFEHTTQMPPLRGLGFLLENAAINMPPLQGLNLWALNILHKC